MKQIAYVSAEDIINGRLVIPEGLNGVYWDPNAEQDCREIEELIIPSSVSCFGLGILDHTKSIVLSEGNPHCDIIDGCLVGKLNNNVVWTPSVCTIPDNTELLHLCPSVKSVRVSSGVTKVQKNVFFDKENLESVEFDLQIKTIPDYAFAHCSSLRTIKFPDTVSYFGECAFYGCPLFSQPGVYKAFKLKDGRLVCHGKEYRVGHKSSVRGKLKLCERGIHYCTNLFNVFNYYCGEYGKDFVIAECEASKERIVSDEKSCARWLRPVRILEREEVVRILNGE